MAAIQWLGHASFRILGAGRTIYIDPWKLKSDEPKADLILISHNHYDHLSVDDVKKIENQHTQIICSSDCVKALHGHVISQIDGAMPGGRSDVHGIIVKTTHAYNIGKKFHPHDLNWLGFLITVGGKTIYYSGDTDVTPEMEHLGHVDIALLPVGGTYTMTAQEAAQAVAIIKPGLAIPYHYADIVGSESDADEFVTLSTAPAERLTLDI